MSLQTHICMRCIHLILLRSQTLIYIMPSALYYRQLRYLLMSYAHRYEIERQQQTARSIAKYHNQQQPTEQYPLEMSVANIQPAACSYRAVSRSSASLILLVHSHYLRFIHIQMLLAAPLSITLGSGRSVSLLFLALLQPSVPIQRAQLQRSEYLILKILDAILLILADN